MVAYLGKFAIDAVSERPVRAAAIIGTLGDPRQLAKARLALVVGGDGLFMNGELKFFTARQCPNPSGFARVSSLGALKVAKFRVVCEVAGDK